MTLEERADLIACANSMQQPGSRAWTLVRERALRQLREAAAHSWREGYGQGIATQRGEAA
jgi:hypothetical protein